MTYAYKDLFLLFWNEKFAQMFVKVNSMYVSSTEVSEFDKTGVYVNTPSAELTSEEWQ